MWADSSVHRRQTATHGSCSHVDSGLSGSTCTHARTHAHKNGRTDRTVIWVVYSGAPKEAQVQSYSPGGANVPSWEGTLAPAGEYDWTVCPRRRCGLMSNYLDDLLLLLTRQWEDTFKLRMSSSTILMRLKRRNRCVSDVREYTTLGICNTHRLTTALHRQYVTVTSLWHHQYITSLWSAMNRQAARDTTNQTSQNYLTKFHIFCMYNFIRLWYELTLLRRKCSRSLCVVSSATKGLFVS